MKHLKHLYETLEKKPYEAHATPNVTNIEKGRGRRMPNRRREEESETPRRDSKKRGERCNTRSTFETFRCNTCNIHMKVDEILETCI
jgi:hypothetical protein